MKDQLIGILEKLDEWIGRTKEEANHNSYYFVSNCEITILGQMGLLVDEDAVLALRPVATVDLDAWVKSEIQIRMEFKKLLKKEGFELDELSNEIWLPEEYESDDFFTGNFVKCKKVKPIYLLVSKAIKAREKNKILIRDAIAEFGQELVDLIEKYEGDINYFLD